MRTLIVDDSKFIREYMKQQLLRLGLPCEEATDGLHGLETLRSGQPFDLMLIDVNMPRMTGLECVRARQQEGLQPEMKVMMVTTEADNHFIEEALGYGADEFLMKPFTMETLRDKLLLMGVPLAA